MKRTLCLALGMLAVSTSLFAQGPAPAGPPPAPTPLDFVLLAIPANLRDGATIIKWKPDYTYDTVRKGTNRMVCFDKAGMPGQQPFSIECSSLGNLDRIAQNLKFEAEPDRAKRKAALDAAEANGTRVKPEYGSVWYHMMGADKDHT